MAGEFSALDALNISDFKYRGVKIVDDYKLKKESPVRFGEIVYIVLEPVDSNDRKTRRIPENWVILGIDRKELPSYNTPPSRALVVWEFLMRPPLTKREQSVLYEFDYGRETSGINLTVSRSYHNWDVGMKLDFNKIRYYSHLPFVCEVMLTRSEPHTYDEMFEMINKFELNADCKEVLGANAETIRPRPGLMLLPG